MQLTSKGNQGEAQVMVIGFVEHPKLVTRVVLWKIVDLPASSLKFPMNNVSKS